MRYAFSEALDAEFRARFETVANRKFARRGCADLSAEIEVSLKEDMDGDSYRVTPRGVSSGGKCGLMAGLGRYLAESRFDWRGGFEPPEREVELHMKQPVRGMYFATHFHNFYHDAPVEEVCEVVDDLALRGCNALMAWYDMHHYAGIDDPESLAMIDRLKRVYRHAKALGMKLCFGTLANEAFSGTPDRLKAEWRAVNGYAHEPVGHYHVEICPSAQGGLAEILRQRREVLRAFSDIPFDFISYWPYDQGGCTCKDCAPWGANGFLRLAPHFERVAREEMPGAKLLCSVWYFDHFIKGEWDAFYERVQSPEYDFFAYLFGFFGSDAEVPGRVRRDGLPGGRKMLSFPEISMRGASPWGGFGANPMPAFLEAHEREVGRRYESGGFPYSEGVYEDANKAVWLGFATGRFDTAREALAEYGRSEFGAEPEAFADLLCAMEETLPRDGVGDRFLIQNPARAEEIAQRALQIDASLPNAAKADCNWRVIFLRALIDRELVRSDGAVNDACDAYMGELCALYHAERALPFLAPPTRKALARS